MSETKYGSMPESVVKEICTAIRTENGNSSDTDEYGVKTFMAYALPILAKHWPTVQQEPLNVEGSENKSCVPATQTAQNYSPEINQLVACLKVQVSGHHAKTNEDVRLYIIAARKALGLSIEEAAQHLVPKGVPQDVAVDNTRLLEEVNWTELGNPVVLLVAIDVSMKYASMLQERIISLVATL